MGGRPVQISSCERIPTSKDVVITGCDLINKAVLQATYPSEKFLKQLYPVYATFLVVSAFIISIREDLTIDHLQEVEREHPETGELLEEFAMMKKDSRLSTRKWVEPRSQDMDMIREGLENVPKKHYAARNRHFCESFCLAFFAR